MMTRILFLCFHVVMLCNTVNNVLAYPLPGVRNKARHFYREGVAFRKSGREEQARKCFIAAIRADSSFTAAYSELGDIYFGKRLYADALICCRKAQQLGADSMSLRIGTSFYYLQQYENAVEALQQAREEEPRNRAVPYLLAQIYAQRGNYRESIHYYLEDLQLDSMHTDAWYRLGMMWFNTADCHNAIVSFEKAAALGYPQDAGFWLNMGVTWLRLQQADKGISCLRKAQQLRPDDEEVLFNLAHACYNKGYYNEAVIHWEKILHLQPTNGFTMFMLGKSYIGAGEQAKGETLCDKALTMGIVEKTINGNNNICHSVER
ncbi:tetratricopeptide repeat protein [Chitinophaga solisilvae]|uniref:tetratricopeptide repeat protein n=1 Tax=Chitinophaga solisilvae TaxID=1233460 RepID=UPI001369B688|nr:tetratricopeptide repeat protein [Chitinophaga solisilvae]